jgi:hypothetical protein
MILLRMYRAELPEEKLEGVDVLFKDLSGYLRPFVAPTLAAQADVFGLTPSNLPQHRVSKNSQLGPLTMPPPCIAAEWRLLVNPRPARLWPHLGDQLLIVLVHHQ